MTMTTTTNEKIKFTVDQVFIDLFNAGLTPEGAVALMPIQSANRMKYGFAEAIKVLSEAHFNDEKYYADFLAQCEAADVSPDAPPATTN